MQPNRLQPAFRQPPIVDVTRPHVEVLAELKQLQADTQQELEALQKART
jgi:hypothetical protein